MNAPAGAALADAEGSAASGLPSIALPGHRRFAIADDLRRKVACACPVWKRLMDIFGSAVLLTLLSPLLLAIGLYIKCVSRGPVLFRQRRFGVGGRPVKVWKFRTIEVGEACGRRRPA